MATEAPQIVSSSPRGSYQFQVSSGGTLLNNADNLERLRRLFRDGSIINDWGPGDPGDFDNGSWHILCHLAGGTGVLRTSRGFAWCAITHMSGVDSYAATVTYRQDGRVKTTEIDGAEGQAVLRDAMVAGFVEGSSLGHILARDVSDPPTAFNHWPRQMFEHPIDSEEDGGTVWEHWATTRDIRPDCAMGMSVLRAYLTLVSLLGGRYVAAVARGRRDYNHPGQMLALVKAGVLTRNEALWDTTPVAIPKSAQDLLYEARPADALRAIESLPWNPSAQSYFMFARRIDRWSRTEDVRHDFETFGPAVVVRTTSTDGNLLKGARVYLSGPMDFVANREDEMRHGWRARIGAFLRDRGCVVFDPWNKPGVRGLADYGREGVDTSEVRKNWTFEDSPAGAATRSKITGKYWETLHIDLRMVDTCDFIVAYCPTNIYSVGTPHEIAMSRLERKPVLFVSPPIEFPALDELRSHLRQNRDDKGAKLLADLENQGPIKPNPQGIPSLWYMPLVGGENFFDGFGFDLYRCEYAWADDGPLDRREKTHQPVRPLLAFLDKLQHELPRRWDAKYKSYTRNDDWLLWELQNGGPDGAAVAGPRMEQPASEAPLA